MRVLLLHSSVCYPYSFPSFFSLSLYLTLSLFSLSLSSSLPLSQCEFFLHSSLFFFKLFCMFAVISQNPIVCACEYMIVLFQANVCVCVCVCVCVRERESVCVYGAGECK